MHQISQRPQAYRPVVKSRSQWGGQNQIYFKKAFSSLLLTLEVQEERLTVDVLVGHEIVDRAGVDAVPVLGVQAEDDEVTVTQREVLLVV